MIINHQDKIRVDLAAIRGFARRLLETVGLGGRDFNVCFVDDREMRRLNAAFRGRPKPTDVLSFPWADAAAGGGSLDRRRETQKAELDNQDLETNSLKLGDLPPASRSGLQISEMEFSRFLGDIVISAETARRNARTQGHSTADEIRWLMLHGVLHLMGFDHETDQGEMTVLELSLRDQLACSRRPRSARGEA